MHSTHSSIVVDFLEKRKAEKEGSCVTWIYCNYNARQSQTAVNLLSSLVRQSLQQLPSLPDYIRSIYNDNIQKRTKLGRKECTELLSTVFRSFSDVFIVVDALDECGKDTATEFIKPVIELPSTRILIMSRDVPYIGCHFHKHPHLDVNASANDIRSYLVASIQEESELAYFVNEDPALYKTILATIVQKSGGMYVDTLG
jgi:hypothetical protein